MNLFKWGTDTQTVDISKANNYINQVLDGKRDLRSHYGNYTAVQRVSQDILKWREAIKQAEKKGLKPVFRLNAYSDILFERFKIKDNKNIFELFPEVDFYDYSKILHRKPPKNYQITYSHYGNWKETLTALKTGLNVAMVFEELPKQLKINNNIYTVIDGDITDLRLDEKINNKSVVVGLKFKGSKAELSHAINTRFAIPNKESIIIC